MTRNIAKGILVGAAIAAGSYIGYHIIGDEEFRSSVADSFQRARASSQQKLDAFNEDVALKRAKVTRNPGVNQGWVEKQWHEIGY
ncbi:hypothetical protein Corgl_1796 [Coriobacterium glomerans PW2]|uniref:Uncharacterized protein n=1 Tax=Coriobacterium glomerans (strain ATCC 49209 / DSM 20642 / JCM 10262 / PW2) TaxID=700015 RepID=F2N9E3_CORGP|nr:hypothetical protein [Coriobacterium glomerans]AEB07891.1 hypothetical protein Corgl_1796 [Coriobacterium glomerans PW2]